MGDQKGLGSYFATGLIIEIWIVILVFVASFIWSFFKLAGMGIVEKFIKIKTPFLSSFAAFLIMICATFILGFVYSKMGKRLISFLEEKIYRISFVGGTMSIIQKIINGEMPAVLVECPAVGIFQIGFVTKEWKMNNVESFVVFIPTPPFITTGILVIVLKDKTERLPISGREVIEYLLGGGSNLSQRLQVEIWRARLVIKSKSGRF